MKYRIKPFFVLIVIVFLLALPGHIFADSGANYSINAAAKLTGMLSEGTATVKTGALNVRSGPGVAYGVVAVIYQGQSVDLLGRNADSSWVKIHIFNGVTGWVNVSLVNPSVAVNTLPVLVDTSTAHVTAGNLNVRSGPAVTFTSLDIVHNGDALTLIARNNELTWLKVRTSNGTIGWVNASQVQTTANISALPVQSHGSGSPEPTATIATGALNIRTQPHPNSGIVAVLGYGQPVVLLGRTAYTGWALVRVYNGAVGWANATYLNASIPFNNLPIVGGEAPSGPSGPPAPPTSPPPGPSSASAIIKTGALNIRSGPGIGYGIETVVLWGQEVSVLGRSASGGWVKVSVGAYTGWVNSAYVLLSVPYYELAIVA